MRERKVLFIEVKKRCGGGALAAAAALALALIFSVLLPAAPPVWSGYEALSITAYGAEREDSRVIDEAGLFTPEERAGLEDRAKAAREETGMDLAVLTILDAEGKSAREFADDYYDDQGFGAGGDYSGALYLIDMDNREIYISVYGEMSNYLTDDRVAQILDRAFREVAEERYASSAEDVLGDIQDCVREGVVSGQYRYNSENGERAYYRRKRSVTWYEALFALAAAGILAVLPCMATVNQYRMKAQRRQAMNYHLAYRGSSQFAFRTASDQFLNRAVTQRRIIQNSGGPRGGAGGGGSGRTTMHRSSSGRMHSGGGRKF